MPNGIAKLAPSEINAVALLALMVSEMPFKGREGVVQSDNVGLTFDVVPPSSQKWPSSGISLDEALDGK